MKRDLSIICLLAVVVIQSFGVIALNFEKRKSEKRFYNLGIETGKTAVLLQLSELQKGTITGTIFNYGQTNEICFERTDNGHILIFKP